MTFKRDMFIRASFKALLISMFELYTSSELALLTPAKCTITSHEETKIQVIFYFLKMVFQKVLIYNSQIYI